MEESLLGDLDNLRMIPLGMNLFNRILVDGSRLLSEDKHLWGVA